MLNTDCVPVTLGRGVLVSRNLHTFMDMEISESLRDLSPTLGTHVSYQGLQCPLTCNLLVRLTLVDDSVI